MLRFSRILKFTGLIQVSYMCDNIAKAKNKKLLWNIILYITVNKKKLLLPTRSFLKCI